MKHRKFITILLSLAIMVTFMPSMAFAAKATSWGDKYATVTDSEETTYKTTRAFGSDGLVTATATNEKSYKVVGESDGVAPWDTEGTAAVRYFYDLDGAVLVYGNSAKNLLDGSVWTKDAFSNLKNNIKVKLVKPSYVTGYKASDDADATAVLAGLNDFSGWDVEVTTSPEKYDEDKIHEDQKFTVSVKFTAADKSVENDGTIVAKADKFGVVATATVTVKATAVTPDNAKVYWDSVGSLNLADDAHKAAYTFYDGSAHNLVAETVDGYTTSYEVYNESTGKYDAVSAVTLTDVNIDQNGNYKDLQVRVVYTKGATVKRVPVEVNLVTVLGAKAGYDLSKSEEDYDAVYIVSGTEYNAESYFTVKPIQEPTKNYSDAKTKAKVRALNAATVKAVAANEKLIKEYFNDYYELSAKIKKSTPYRANLSIKNKELTSDEEKTLAKKYAALVANVGIDAFNFIDTDEEIDSTAIVYFNEGVYDYEVTFTKAPAGTTTYKAKKSTKKLAKNKTITVQAVANDGVPVYYKLVNANSKITIDKNTGKITIKKGLKKGTYTFKVKAYVLGNYVKDRNTYDWFDVSGFAETQTIKVKVK